MDSKSSMPTSYDEEQAAPPAYTESVPACQPHNPSYQPYTSTSQYYSHQIQDQLLSITTQIKSLETQKSLLSHAKDEKILSLLTTQIQIYLSDFAKTGLHKGTLILVPAHGLEDGNAVPMEYDFKDPDEYDRIVKVRDKEAGEFGDEMWFWKDEAMALRLAGYLRPKKDLKNAELPARKENTKQVASGSSKGFWGRRKSNAKAVDRPPLVEERMDVKVDSDAKQPISGIEDKVLMDVKAEEVVFRTENDFGIYETQRGWGMVLKLRVILGKK